MSDMPRYAHVPNATLRASTVVRAALSPRSVDSAEAAVTALLGGRHAVLFASARGALTAAIRATVDHDDTVQVPAYTCVAVPNAVRSAGCNLGWIDVDGVGRPSCSGDQAQALLAQDTFGFPCAPKPAEAPVIRDASHRADLIFEATEGISVTVTSFEHSKWLSAGLGGVAVTADEALAQAMRDSRDAAQARRSSFRHAFVTLGALMSGRALFGGRRALGMVLHRLTAAIDGDWMRGQSDLEVAGQGVSANLLGRPTPVAAALMVAQLSVRAQVAAHRSRMVATYDAALGAVRQPLPLVRYPLEVADRERAHVVFRQAGWELGRPWFDGLVHPAAADPRDFGLDPTAFPAASKLAARVLNLPTHPLVSVGDAEDLARLAAASGARPLVAD